MKYESIVFFLGWFTSNISVIICSQIQIYKHVFGFSAFKINNKMTTGQITLNVFYVTNTVGVHLGVVFEIKYLLY